jgi:hypothetical protein
MPISEAMLGVSFAPEEEVPSNFAESPKGDGCER